MKILLILLLCTVVTVAAERKDRFHLIENDSTQSFTRKGDTTRVNINRKAVLKKPIVNITLPDLDATLAGLELNNSWMNDQDFKGVYNTEKHGPDLIADFTTGLPGWSGPHWSYQATGKALHTPGVIDTLASSIAVEKYRVYRLSWTVTGASAGTIYASFGSDSTLIFPFSGLSGWGGNILTRSTSGLKFIVSADFNGAISGVSLRKVPAFVSIDSLGNGFALFTDAAGDQRFLTTKGLWIQSFQNFPFSINANGFHRGFYVDPDANVSIKDSNTLSHTLAVGGNLLINKKSSTGSIVEIRGAYGDRYYLGMDANGFYGASGMDKALTFYNYTRGYFRLNSNGTAVLNAGVSGGSILDIIGATGEILHAGIDSHGPYFQPGYTSDFSIYNGTGSITLSSSGNTSIIGKLSVTDTLSVGGLSIGGASIYDGAHTWTQPQIFAQNTRVVTSASAAGFNLINTNTAGESVIALAQRDDGSTDFYFSRYGSTHATRPGEVEIRSVGNAPFRFMLGAAGFDWYNNGAFRMRLHTDGSLTLGSTIGVGTGPIFAGSASIANDLVIGGNISAVRTTSNATITKADPLLRLVTTGGSYSATLDLYYAANSGASVSYSGAMMNLDSYYGPTDNVHTWGDINFRVKTGGGSSLVNAVVVDGYTGQLVANYGLSVTGAASAGSLTLTTPLASSYIGAHTHADTDLSGVTHWKGSLASEPSSPAEGWEYYDTALNQRRVYTGGAWKP